MKKATKTMNKNELLGSRLALGGALALAFAGCGTSGGSKSGGGTISGGGGGRSDDPLAVVSDNKPARKVSNEEREDFAKALAKYQDMRKGGRLDPGDCNAAAKVFRSTADDNPNLKEARYNEGAVLLECGKESEAVRIFEQLANGSPPFAPAITSLGYLAWKKGDTATAERQFNRAIELDQRINSVPARNNLAQILREKVQRASGGEKTPIANQAIQQLRSLLALDGNNLQAYSTYSALYLDLGYLEMARLVGNQAIKRADEIATGKVEEESRTTLDEGKKGKEGKAADAPKASRESGGTGYTADMKIQLGQVHNTLGLVELRKKNVTAAIASFKRAIDMDPTLNEARMNLAAISLNFRDYQTAETNFREVLKSQPKNFEAALGLGVALRGNKKFDEAEQQYVSAQQIDSTNPQPLYNLGLLYQDYKGGERAALGKAQGYYRDFLAKGSAVPARQRKEAEKRIKDIDEMFKALDEAEKLQKEAEEMQRKAEEQQKKMEEEMKKMQEQEKQQQGGGAAPAGTTPPAATQPAGPNASK